MVANTSSTSTIRGNDQMAEAPQGRQAEILAFIEEHVASNGYPPTVREIGEGVARFCSPDDPRAWAEAIGEIARNNLLRVDMQDAGLARAA